MDEKEAGEHAEDVLGHDEPRYDDPSDAIKWHNHSEEEERLLKECRDYVRGYIGQLDTSIEPGYNELICATFTGCDAHGGMCIGLNPNNPKMAEIYDKPVIVVEGDEKPLVDGVREIAESVVRRNSDFVGVEQGDYYDAEFHLIVREP